MNNFKKKIKKGFTNNIFNICAVSSVPDNKNQCSWERQEEELESTTGIDDDLLDDPPHSLDDDGQAVDTSPHRTPCSPKRPAERVHEDVERHYEKRVDFRKARRC